MGIFTDAEIGSLVKVAISFEENHGYPLKKKVFQTPDAIAPGGTSGNESESPSGINIPYSSIVFNIWGESSSLF